MLILLTIIHVIVCLFLVIVVLLQSGKAADLAGAFGGMGSQTVFGPRGSATVLSKATTVAAALFMVTSLGLSVLATRGGSGGGSSILDKAKKAPPASSQKNAAQPAGKTVPLQITPSVDGKQGPTQTLPTPIQPAPAPGQQPVLPYPKAPPSKKQ